jgi:hypothetical protein
MAEYMRPACFSSQLMLECATLSRHTFLIGLKYVAASVNSMAPTGLGFKLLNFSIDSRYLPMVVVGGCGKSVVGTYRRAPLPACLPCGVDVELTYD